MKILIAQRDPAVIQALRGMLEHTNNPLSIADTSVQGWESAIESDFGLVVADWDLPGLNGLELCRRLRENHRAPHVYILLTRRDGTGNDHATARRAGADDFISTPFDSDEMACRIDDALCSLERERDRRRAPTRSLERAVRPTVLDAVHALPIAAFTLTSEGRIHDWNAAAAALYGLRADQVVRKALWNTIARREDAGRLRACVERVFQGEALEGVEWACARPDGALRRVLCNAYPLRTEQGTVMRALCATVDVTERVQDEERMRLLAQVTEMSPNGVVVTNAKERVLYVNPAFEALSGYRLEEVRGLHPGRLLQGSDTDSETRKAVREAINARRPVTVEISNYTKNGAPYRVEMHVAPVLDEQKRCTHFFAVENDITRWKTSEDAILLNEERFRSAINAMHEGLVAIDAEGVIRLCNRGAEAILGMPADTLIGRTFQDPRWNTIREDGSDFAGEAHPIMTALNTGASPQNVIMGIYRPDADLTWISINAAPLLGPGEPRPHGAVATMADITERKRFEHQIDEQMLRINEACLQLECQKMELEAVNAKLEALAITDGLTGLKNHRAFQEQLELEFLRSQRYHTPLSVVLLDVDMFKSYNDTFGHPAGDEVLKLVATLLTDNLRVTDFVARYGGEEFIIILSNTDKEGALSMAERFRLSVETAPWPRRVVTASFGITSQTGMTRDRAQLVAEADAALYWSKQNGRNRVAHYEDVAPDILRQAA